jgi:hypothetical protein
VYFKSASKVAKEKIGPVEKHIEQGMEFGGDTLTLQQMAPVQKVKRSRQTRLVSV